MNLKTDIGNKRKKNIALGRKTIKSGEQGKHNKYSDDNLRRKSKHLIVENLREFINGTIKAVYRNNIGQGILIKQFFTMNQEQIKNSYIDYNKDFLNKTLGEIFSENICKRFTSYPLNHNKNLVNKLLNEDNEQIKNIFTDLFNLTFKEVLIYIKGEKEIWVLNGLKNLDKVLQKYEEEPEYMNMLKYYILNYIDILEKKKSRKPREQPLEIKVEEFDSIF